MGKSTPAPPPAPDYAAANREGIYADIDTLATRRQIEQAARLGEQVTYREPDGGMASADFTGIGDIDITTKEARELLKLVPEMSEAQLANLIEYGPKFIEAQREQLRQVSPEEFDLREDFARRLRTGEGTSEALADTAPSVPTYEEVDAPVLADTGATAALRADVEGAIADRLALGESLSGEQIRALEQDVLKAAASRGQTLGGGTALREVLGKFRAGEELGRQRRAEAMGLLASGQASSDVQNRLAQQNFANAMGRVQQINQARGAAFAGQQQNLGQQLAARQQDVSNIQSLLGLQPVAAQGGYMSGFQQGAAPFTMPQMQRGIGLNPNAGAQAAQFAGDVFGTQSSNWQVQAQLPSSFERTTAGIANISKAMKGGSGFFGK